MLKRQRPNLSVRTASKKSDSNAFDSTLKSDLSILASYSETTREQVDQSNNRLTPRLPRTSLGYGPPGIPGNFEYMQWFNEILLHDLGGHMRAIKQVTNRGPRCSVIEEPIDTNIQRRNDLLYECLKHIQHDIRGAVDDARRRAVGRTDFSHVVTNVIEQEIEAEVEAWMTAKSQLNVEISHACEDIARSEQQNQTECNPEGRYDVCGREFSRLLQEYDQLIIK